MQKKTETYYQQKVSEVLSYIHNHLSDELNVKLLSEQFGISFFHFHRIMKVFLDEPLGSYINRIRLETAVKLIRYSDTPLSEIALRIGYGDSSAFSKAFSKEFGFSPQKFKSDKTIVLNTHVDYKIDDVGKLVYDSKPKIVSLADKTVICTSYMGEYGGDEFKNVWNQFWQFVSLNNLMSWKSEIFTVYYDDPFVTAASDCRADFCVATYKQLSGNSSNIEVKKIPGGRFAMFKYKGSYERLMEIYEYLLKILLFKLGRKLRDAPSIERYLNDYRKIEPNSILTEIFIPIE
jgi:AraC family transcriptional regulator